jgi:pectinesterase
MFLLSVFGLAFLLAGFAPAADNEPLIVSSDGPFKTVQSAIDSIPDNNTEPRVIVIKPGTYTERIQIPAAKPSITMRGDDPDPTKTVLTFGRHSGMDDPDAPGKKVGTSGSESLLISADNFTAENLTFENSAGDIGQAVAVRTMGDRIAFHHCRFLGWQDTLYVNGGRTYFGECYVEGRVDFIFGRATAVFDQCTIHSKNGGYVTAASTKPQSPFGLVFLDCTLTGDGAAAFLGRPWKPGAATAFIRCNIGAHIRPEGWSQWSGNDNHTSARYAVYQNTGPGADPSKYPGWTKQLTADEASNYTVEKILSGADHWSPAKSN